MSIPMFLSHKPLKLLAGTAAAALLMGWAAGIGARAADPSLSPLPAAASAPALPLGHDDIREVQNQLIALGYDPGPADGEAGPGTFAAAQQYDQKHGGTGPVSIDSALLARLKADAGPRLTYEQVAERSQARQQAQASAPASASNQIGGIVQQIAPLLGAVIANSNTNSYGPGYYGPGPGYYGPPPGYYRQGYYGGF